jgi:hypothetical protein
MDGIAGYGGWQALPIRIAYETNTDVKYRRWIFIIEGAFTVAAAVVMNFWITDWPDEAKFLNNDERALLLARLSADTGDAVMNRFDKRAAKRIFSDPKIYLGVAAYFGMYYYCYLISYYLQQDTH